MDLGIGILSAAGILGYLYNQEQREKNFKNQNSKILNNNNVIYNQNPYNQIPPVPQVKLENPITRPTNNTRPNLPTKPIEGFYDPGPKLGTGSALLNDSNYVSANDPRSTYLKDANKRPIEDFVHANMVPFATKFTQNMAGTGVVSGSYVDGVTVNTGTDLTTPFQDKVALFTGLDDTWLHKREAGPMFSPAEQQQNWVYKMPLIRPDLDYYTRSIKNYKDLKPTESVMVGPGIDLDPSIPAEGGFQQFTRVMPNNVSDYKANQLEGRVLQGKFVTGAELPTSYPGVGTATDKAAPGVVKHRPPTFYSQTRYPTMSNKAGIVKNFEERRADFSVDKRPKNPIRDQTSYGYGHVNALKANYKTRSDINYDTAKKFNENIEFFEDTNNSSGVSYNNALANEGPCLYFTEPIGISPAKPSMNIPVRSHTYMSQDNNIRSVVDNSSIPAGAPSFSVKGPTNLNNYYVNQTDRGTINPTLIEQVNLKGKTTNTFNTWTDAPKTTMKETTEFAYAGDVYDKKSGYKFYTYKDEPKTTMKETTEFAYAGDVYDKKSGYKFYTYEDEPKTTMKETTEFAYAGDVNKQGSIETSRFQYTGSDDINMPINYKEHFTEIETQNEIITNTNKNQQNNISKKPLKLRTGGADLYTNRSTTLVTNYFPGPDRKNILADPNQKLGRVQYGLKGSDSYLQGPGTLYQSIPDGSRFQNNRIFAVPQFPPNKLFSVDNRQLDPAQVKNLEENPLSIYTRKPNDPIPSFEQFNEPDDYSELINDKELTNYSDVSKDHKFYNSENVYPPADNTDNYSHVNPNSVVVFGNLNNNPLISQGSSQKVNSNPTFSGLGYSGKFSNSGYNPEQIRNAGSVNNKDKPDEVIIYEPGKYVKEKGLPNIADINLLGRTEVYKPSKSLTFSNGVFMPTMKQLDHVSDTITNKT